MIRLHMGKGGTESHYECTKLALFMLPGDSHVPRPAFQGHL